MSPARRWYERVLGGVLMLLGLCTLVPIAAFGVWASHMYTVGLSVNLETKMIAVVVVSGIVSVLGGIALMRRT